MACAVFFMTGAVLEKATALLKDTIMIPWQEI
jgi:hypothetical protein